MYRALWVGFELGAELGDDHAKVLHVILMGGSPDLCQGLAVSNDLVGASGEESEELEFLGREVYLHAIDEDATMFEVEQDIAKALLCQSGLRRT